jgi:hypothetical protein
MVLDFPWMPCILATALGFPWTFHP